MAACCLHFQSRHSALCAALRYKKPLAPQIKQQSRATRTLAKNDSSGGAGKSKDGCPERGPLAIKGKALTSPYY